jgi:hypothetical protein
MKKLYLRFSTHRYLEDVTLVEELEDFYIYKMLLSDVDIDNGECFSFDLGHYCDLLASYEAASYSLYVQ